MKPLKLYQATFDPMWPVPSGLIILAYDLDGAIDIANETVTHAPVDEVIEIYMDKPKVVFYESGDY